jgi:hypothetical protein
MSDWSCRQREARSHLRLFHLVLGSHDGRALVPIPKRSAYPASDLDVVVVDSLKALDPNRPIREVGHVDARNETLAASSKGIHVFCLYRAARRAKPHVGIST